MLQALSLNVLVSFASFGVSVSFSVNTWRLDSRPGIRTSSAQSLLWAPVSVNASRRSEGQCVLARFKRELRSIVVRRGCFGSRCFADKVAEWGALYNNSIARMIVSLYSRRSDWWCYPNRGETWSEKAPENYDASVVYTKPWRFIVLENTLGTHIHSPPLGLS